MANGDLAKHLSGIVHDQVIRIGFLWIYVICIKHLNSQKFGH
jgi:hypothetical protein